MGSLSLRAAHNRGYEAALRKFALASPTVADAFAAEVDEGKDMPPPMPPPMAPGMDGMEAPALPQDLGALGDPTGAMPTKDAALGLKDMHFFEKMLGPDEARSMFQGIERSMSGQTRGIPQTLNITPQGVQRLPHPGLGAQAAQAAKGPPPIPAAALRPRMPGR